MMRRQTHLLQANIPRIERTDSAQLLQQRLSRFMAALCIQESALLAIHPISAYSSETSPRPLHERRACSEPMPLVGPQFCLHNCSWEMIKALSSDSGARIQQRTLRGRVRSHANTVIHNLLSSRAAA
eukprot:scaffold164_cov19-Prasinocladus_malaysianus.AAC.2